MVNVVLGDGEQYQRGRQGYRQGKGPHVRVRVAVALSHLIDQLDDETSHVQDRERHLPLAQVGKVIATCKIIMQFGGKDSNVLRLTWLNEFVKVRHLVCGVGDCGYEEVRSKVLHSMFC